MGGGTLVRRLQGKGGWFGKPCLSNGWTVAGRPGPGASVELPVEETERALKGTSEVWRIMNAVLMAFRAIN